jgi:hypothetical protein
MFARNVDEPSDLEGICNEPDDPADAMDADIFEELLHDDPTSANPNRPLVNDPLETPEDATQQADQSELDDQPDTVDQETASGLIIDPFPFGSPGAPIPEKFRGSSAYEVLREMHTDNPWAPFSSQLDWKVARWAKKMHNLTAAAVTQLLAIPGVRVCYSLNIMQLI